MMWLELLILLTCIVIGARVGGIGLGTIGGIGLLIFVFVFKLPPGSPPGIVLGMIIAVITALAAMQAAGGLDYLVSIAGKIMKKKPQYITFVAPLVTYILIFASGTQHVIYALLPVISEVSAKAGVRPERPLSISVIAAQHGLIASPISAASVALLAALASFQVSLLDILMVIIPATLLGVIAGTLSVAWKGKKLSEDPIYQERLKAGKITEKSAEIELSGEKLRNAVGSNLLFLLAIISVVIIGIIPELRPQYQMLGEGKLETGQVDMGQAIMIIMLAAAGLMMLFFKAKAEEAVKGSIMKGGIVAVISILGVSWMGSSFFEGNRVEIVNGISGVIQQAPWVFALGLFVLSMLLFSQAATVVTLVPVAVALGLPAATLIAVYPAVNGYFFLPTYGTILAAVSFDQTGTTRIGKYLLNHSFMLPGLVTTISATVFALIISRLIQ
ncbi:MAG: anaerobic C4-dicarboxylate transporter [Calditrichaceae bacterium]|nr:anaerobic C4-dicarboxylate transporter [Calditrichia bacterium]NUQ43621.1 anaerobic C4-dicarboxylate transporter [Calditrichaceae bacterium]